MRADKLSVKDQISALGFAGHTFLYHKYSTLLHSMKAAKDNMLMHRCGFVPIKLYKNRLLGEFGPWFANPCSIVFSISNESCHHDSEDLCAASGRGLEQM